MAARAATLPEAERYPFIDQALDGDQAAIASVKRLLALADQSTVHDAGSDRGEASVAALPVIPGFRVRELLGRGGMGSVYRAEQIEPRREVAIKLIRTDLSSPGMNERLRREADVLARLSHPAIAAIHAAGSVGAAPDHQPYLVMALIRGRSLDHHVAENRLDVRAVVGLIREVAEGVAHAHRHGVVHRDLKPANILVDDDGRPHILDFGIATVSELEPGQASVATGFGELVGTLSYMAPEQFRGRADERSDVYALGVTLYQALSNSLPHDLSASSLIDALDVLTEQPPTPLIKRNPEIPRRLATVVMHALTREPDHRYASVSDFITDLDNFLNDRPLIAQPPGLVDLLWMGWRRNRLAVSAVLGVAASVLIGLGLAVHFAVRAEQARQEAELRSAQVEAVNRFIQDMLLAADPERSLGDRIGVVDVLDGALGELDRSSDIDPRVRGDLYRLIGSTLVNLGRAEAGSQALDRAVGLLSGDGSESTRVEAAIEAARAQLELGRIDSANQALDLLVTDPLAGPGGPLHAHYAAVAGRGLLQAGQAERAGRLLQDALEESTSRYGWRSPETMVLRQNLAEFYQLAGILDQRLELLEELVVDRTDVFGAKHPQTLAALNNLGGALFHAAEPERAREVLSIALEGRRLIYGRDHAASMTTANNLAAVLIHLGERELAEPLLREVLEWHRERLGPEHAKTLIAGNLLAYLLEDAGRLDEAEAQYRAVLTAMGNAQGGLVPDLIAVGNNLAMLLVGQQRHAEAETIFADLLAETETAFGRDHLYYAIFASNYGECLLGLERFDQARSVLGESHERLQLLLGDEHPRVSQVRERLARAELGPGPGVSIH